MRTFLREGIFGLARAFGILIDSIYISPYAPKWFAEVVKNVVDRYEIKKPVYQSSMLVTPFF